MRDIKYVIITPARNEEAYIEKTIQSVIAQTILPQKWVIVSDGSTDHTDEIAQKYAIKYSWIEFMRMPQHADRNFAAKVNAFNAGYNKIRDTQYEFIGNLDADISFESDYFEFILNKFYEIPGLGVAGTPFVEEGGPSYDYRFTNIEHVSGQCQLFRRDCFEDIGGYVPIKGGGVDWVAVVTARINGWKTRTFREKINYHHRKMGTGESNIFRASFKQGREDYFLGNHPLWQVLRSFYQVKNKPYILRGILLLSGYTWALLCRVERPISNDMVQFHRNEEMQRLIRILKLK